MAILVGNGLHLTITLGASGAAAQGTVLSASDLGQVISIQTDGTLAPGNNAMNVGDSFVVDTDNDGDFTDEVATTQSDNDRYVNSTVTYADGSTSNIRLELITLSDGSQAILVNDAAASDINAASDEIQSITLGTFNTQFDNRYSQSNFSNTITNTVVCFTSGTSIRTQSGEVFIEDLTKGDMVLTVDHGYQPIRWIGSSKRAATGDLAPILIRKGALGNDRDLRVSPQHRMLLQGWKAELLFGETEVLATAKSLINDHSIIRVEGGEVEYFHMLFDTHEIIWAEGALSESFHPGEQGWKALDEPTRSEILDLFPQLADGNLETYGPAARMSLKHKDGALLIPMM